MASAREFLFDGAVEQKGERGDIDVRLHAAVASSISTSARGMPEPRLPMRKVRDVLRLSAAGMSKRKIAASLGMSATAARDCIWRARRAGLAWPDFKCVLSH
jgi:hypothetical protein